MASSSSNTKVWRSWIDSRVELLALVTIPYLVSCSKPKQDKIIYSLYTNPKNIKIKERISFKIKYLIFCFPLYIKSFSQRKV